MRTDQEIETSDDEPLVLSLPEDVEKAIRENRDRLKSGEAVLMVRDGKPEVIDVAEAASAGSGTSAARATQATVDAAILAQKAAEPPPSLGGSRLNKAAIIAAAMSQSRGHIGGNPVRLARGRAQLSIRAGVRSAVCYLPAPPSPPKGLRVGRNAKCPCGSGKKFKTCCYDKRTSAPILA